jgi:hypothetical protein
MLCRVVTAERASLALMVREGEEKVRSFHTDIEPTKAVQAPVSKL